MTRKPTKLLEDIEFKVKCNDGTTLYKIDSKGVENIQTWLFIDPTERVVKLLDRYGIKVGPTGQPDPEPSSVDSQA